MSAQQGSWSGRMGAAMVVKAWAGLLGRALLAALLCAGGAGGAEQLDAGRRSELIALHGRLSAARDVWSALQLESYARARGLQLPPVLGGAHLIGDPLLAFPRQIDRLWEGAGWEVVWAHDRIYFLAEDGCPLRGARALGRAPMRMALSRYGQHICTVDRDEQGPWQVTVSGLADGVAVLHATLPARAGEFYAYDPRVADDGSAAMVAIIGHDPGEGRDRVRTVVVTRGGALTIEQGLGLGGVGPDGGWAAVWNPQTKRSELRSHGRVVECARIACGGGAAACAAADRLQLARAEGGLAEVPAPFPLGPLPDVLTVGDWLVLGSDAAVGEHVAFYRWSELAADPLAPPVRVLAGRCSAMSRDQGALWLANGREYAAVDCSGAALRVTPLGTASGIIQRMSDEFDRCLIQQAGGILVCEPAGPELWSGPCNGWYLITADLLIIRRDQDGRAPHRLVRLARDPGGRAELPLELDARPWRVAYDHTHDVLSARCGDAWMRLDPRTGRALPGTGGGAEPPYETRSEHAGRLVVDYARLVPRGAAPRRPELRLLCTDAWTLAGTTYLTTVRAQLLTVSAAGEWADHGICAGATHLGLDARGRLSMAGHGDVHLASLVPVGGRLGFERDPMGRLEVLQSPDWQVRQDGQFTPPGGVAMRWDDGVGFSPIALRAPGAGALLAVTASVVIEVPPTTVALLAKPVATR